MRLKINIGDMSQCHDMVITGTGIKTLLLNFFKAFASNECDAFSVDMALIFTEPQPC